MPTRVVRSASASPGDTDGRRIALGIFLELGESERCVELA